VKGLLPVGRSSWLILFVYVFILLKSKRAKTQKATYIAEVTYKHNKYNKIE